MKRSSRQYLAWILLILMMTMGCLDGLDGIWKVRMDSYGASVTISRKSGNLLDGKAFDFFGKQNRSGLWFWCKKGGGPLFCIEPQKGMTDGVSASVTWEGIGEQGRLTPEQYDLLDGALRFAHAIEGQNHAISQSDYIVAQSAVWAILSGEWQDTEHFKEEMEKIYSHLGYASGTEKAAIIKNCRKAVDLLCNDLNGFCGNDNPYIPSFASKYELDAPVHGMTAGPDGSYEASFPLTGDGKSPYIRDFTYDMPDGWDYRYEKDHVIFRRRGGPETAEIKGTARPGTQLAKCRPLGVIGFVVAGSSSRQKMIGELRVDSSWECYLKLVAGGDVPVPGGDSSQGGWYVPEVRRYLHKEEFVSDYGVELEKRDSETGQLLADATFEIWEAFDAGQLAGTRLEPDKVFQWDGYQVFCAPETTDGDGWLCHRDRKAYPYEKTYCGGHPEPVFEEDEDGGDEDGLELASDDEEGDDGDDDAEREAWEAWQEQVDECEAICDFHSLDDSAVQDMLEDRDGAYEDFIGLEYAYWAKEIRPRGGYVTHGLHHDDLPVPAVVFSSSQDGGEGRAADPPPEMDFAAAAVLDGGVSLALEEREGWEELQWEGIYLDREGGGSFLTSAADVVSPRGTTDKLAYCFLVEDHRTEGEVHISKRDLELYQKDPDGSLAKAQGEGTLAGAVYGLYAAQDIPHPDGRTGVVFGANDLVAIATTDGEGSASFRCITEVSPSSQTAANREGSWLGHPLLLGKYYVKEIARSEGYELSVYGINLEGSNQGAAGPGAMAPTGTAVAGAWSHRINDWDGSWNDTVIECAQTSGGVDVYVSGYPEDTQFYYVEERASEDEERVVTGSRLEERRDEDGQVIYQTAKGGEYRLDEDGNRQEQVDEDGQVIYDETRPRMEFIPSMALKRQIVIGGEGPASPSEAESWGDPASQEVVREEVDRWLEMEGYQVIEDGKQEGAPWTDIPLSGSSNGEWIQAICDYFTEDPFWDAASVEGFYKKDGQWHARVFYDCLGASLGQAVKDRETGRIFVKKAMVVKDGPDTYQGHYYVCYDDGEWSRFRLGVLAGPMREIEGVVQFGEELEGRLEVRYEPCYQIYRTGELLLDREGNPIPETEVVYQYETLSQTHMEEVLTPVLPISYEADSGIHTLHLPNKVDWEHREGKVSIVLRAKAPDATIQYDGREMAYADYLSQVKGIGVTAAAGQTGLEAGSYMKEVLLAYPGALQVSQDMGTRLSPVIVLQRAIKQPVKVEKDISLSSYEGVNTYRIHRDPFTVLFGGYGTKLANTLPGFFFRAYAVKDLEETGLLTTGEDGGYEYEAFFKAYPLLAEELALDWDRPAFDLDGDLTTVHASEGGGNIAYYGCSEPLPYGRYVVVEQQPVQEAANRHYAIAPPQEIVVPFVAQVDEDGTVHHKEPSYAYHYHPDLTAEEQTDRFQIRFRPEDHVLKAHGHDGDYLVYKYGRPEESEQEGVRDHVYYEVYRRPDGTVEDYGVTKDQVPVMSGKLTAVDRAYAAPLVPWSVMEPDFLHLSYENTFYSSKLRIEKLDRGTGENIIHDGAYFKIYAAMRDIEGTGNGVSGTGNIRWNPDGTPMYDEKEEIRMVDTTGEETGIFRAYATLRDIVTNEGVKQEMTGYIETYQPLGAGVYVLVEVEPPAGYVRSNPIAFEIYSDQVSYYADGDPNRREEARQYQYMHPADGGAPAPPVEVSQVPVLNTPTHIKVHKVEAGEETLTYQVEGSLRQLKARADAIPCYGDDGAFAGYGLVSRQFDEYSKTVAEDGSAGYEIYVGGAVLKLYEGVVLETEDGAWKGVTVMTDGDGRTVRITDTNTGTHGTVGKAGQSGGKAGVDIWDFVEEANPPVSLYFYDLKEDPVEWSEDGAVLYGLDGRGNRICRLDPSSGLAYVLDDKQRAIAYVLDQDGGKRLVKSIQVNEDEQGRPFIYTGVQTVDDENGLPVYYLDGGPQWEDQVWETSDRKEPHAILRLPVGAYVLEEDEVPFSQGYVQSQAVGIVVEEKEGGQDYWMEDDFTKIEIAKVDLTTKEEIPDAHMTLYRAIREGDHLEIRMKEDGTPDIYTQWISGYQYDDDGNLVAGDDGLPVRTTKPHWIDHIPVGDYLLEETVTPHGAGYVHTESMEIVVLETGRVQSFTMEDDYTRWEIHKQDAYLGTPVAGATLALYEAVLDGSGNPAYEDLTGGDGKGRPLCGPLVLSWKTTKEGTEVMGVDTTRKGTWMRREDGSIYLEYMPIGYYVLVEEETPVGYATTEPLVIRLEEVGGKAYVQQTVMEDIPLTADLSKVGMTGSQEVAGAVMALYQADEDGEKGRLVEWWVSTSSPHRITHLWKGDYILTEWLAPEGLLAAEEVRFTIEDTEAVQEFSMRDAIPEGILNIMKKASDGGQALADAVFRLSDRATGEEIEVLKTDAFGMAVSKPLPIGGIGEDGIWRPCLYEIREIQAPAGYLLDGTAHEVQFPYEGPHTATVTFACELENRRIPTNPGGGGDTPVKPTAPTEPEPTAQELTEEPVALGSISVSYQVRPLSLWDRMADEAGRLIPKVGDFATGSVWWWLSMLAAASGIGFLRRKGRLGRRLGFGLLAGLLAAGLLLGNAALAYAAEEAAGTEGIGKERSIPVEDPASYPGPDVLWYDEEGDLYELQDWNLVQVEKEGSDQALEREVMLEEVEEADMIPPSLDIEAEDMETGLRTVASCSLRDAVPVESYWLPDFQMGITFHRYDAGNCMLGDVKIPYDEVQPQLAGHEKALLQTAGLDPERYRIERIAWSGEPYISEEGDPCRDAVAFGQRKVDDYRLSYTGVAHYPAQSVWECHAAYRLAVAPPTVQPMNGRPIPESTWAEPVPAAEPVASRDWLRMLRMVWTATVFVAAIMMAVTLFLLLAIWRKNQVKKRRTGADSV